MILPGTLRPRASTLIICWGYLARNGRTCLLQIFGISVFLLPVHIWALGWKWVRSSAIESPWFRVVGALALWFCLSTACGLVHGGWLIMGAVRPSGIVGMVIADYLTGTIRCGRRGDHYGGSGNSGDLFCIEL